jgi:hypothetical protein
MATKLSPVGTEFQVNQITANNQSFPDITPLSDGRFIVVYRRFFDSDGDDIDILGQFVNPNGTLSGATRFVADSSGIQDDPAVAARSGGGFTTVWQDFGLATGSPIADPDIYYAVTNSAGTNTVTRTLLIDSVFVLQNPDIATMSDLRQIVVAERDVDINNTDIVFDVLEPDGTTQLFGGSTIGLAASVSNTRARNPQVAGGGPERALLVYEDNNGEPNVTDIHITARLFNETTNTFGSGVLIGDAGAGHSMVQPDVAYIGAGRFAIVYDLDQQSIFARVYNSNTGALSPEIAVSAAVVSTAFLPKVAATQDGGFVVTWSDFAGPAPDTDGFSIHARRFDPYGNPFGDDFVVNTLTNNWQTAPVVGISGGNVLTAWEDFASRPSDMSPPSIQAQAATAPAFDYDSAAYGDFDNDGRSDVLLQSLSTGAVAILSTNSAGVLATGSPVGSLPAGFKIDGTGNFNSTPGDDILLRSAASGQVAVWVMNGKSAVDFKVLGSTSSQFLNSGIGDFTGDGQSDLLFRNTGTGEIASWQIVDNALGAPPKVLGSAPSVYQIVTVADFTGDHQADILFRNLNTGEIAEWQLANNQLAAPPAVVGSTSAAYHVVGTGDFDGNGANDILFRHDNGELAMWLLNSAGQLLTAPQVVGSAALIYHVEGTGDLNGDGRSDIVFRDTAGNVIEWLMNGATIQTIQSAGGVSQDFSIAPHHFDLI